MRHFSSTLLSLILVLGLIWPLTGKAQINPPVTQCVTQVLGGGTGDAITTAMLPCVPTTTLLILTNTASNTITNPTLQPVGTVPQVIVRSDGSALAVGELVVGGTEIFINNGSEWKKLTSIGTGILTLNQGDGITLTPNPIVGPTGLIAGTLFSSVSQGDAPASGGGTTNFLRADGTWAAPPGSGIGTVTSVGLGTPGGIFGLTGTNPITSSGTFSYTTSGTSGGIPYFSSGVVLSSSGQLSAHSAVIGGGSGTAPTTVAGCTGGVFAWSTSGVDPACTATPTLGASGTPGSVTFGNATSGLLSLQPVTGALGTVTASLPANTGMIAELNLAQAWSAAQRGVPVNVAISTATFTPNFNGANHFEIDLTSACPCTLANPSTTLVAGQSGIIEIHQDGSGSRTIGTWGSDYQYVGGTSTITLSTTASAVDYLPYYVNNAATGIVLGTLLAGPVH